MMTGCRELVLYVPGLWGGRSLRSHFRAAAQAHDLGQLARLLSRAQPLSLAAGVYQGLCQLCAVPPGDGRQLPLAALSRYGEQQAARGGYWLRADPVCLEADRDCVVMRDWLAPDGVESRELLTLLNAHLAQDGLRLEAGAPGRWYLPLDRVPALVTHPLHEVLGQDIHPWLPGGEEGRYWRRLLNETQMLLHDSAANEARRAAGQLPVTSLWFWGGGTLPAAPAQQWAGVWAREPVARGLALLGGNPLHELPPGGGQWLQQLAAPGRYLLVWDDLWHPALLADPETWVQRLAQWQVEWLEPLLAAVARDGAISLILYGGDGRGYHVTARRLKRWWRRTRPFAGFLDAMN